MSKIIIPANYTPALNLYDTQRAIGTVKRLFADTLCATLNLYRVSAPLFVEASTGLNDDLNGVERKVTFDTKDSGIEVQESNAFSWRIPGHQQYKSHSCHLNGDYSQAAVLCCAGALGHDITVTHLSPVTTQGDRAILRHLMALGATVEESDNHIRVKAGKLHGATLDMHDCPDIAPILALTAQLAEGESRLTHCGRLRLKECDRLAATVEILNLLGGDAKADGDDIVLHGVKQLRGGVTLPNYGDHRMVMLASIAATKCEQPIEMDGIEAIDKSWPEYLKVYQMLGGKCE